MMLPRDILTLLQSEGHIQGFEIDYNKYGNPYKITLQFEGGTDFIVETDSNSDLIPIISHV